MYWFWDLRLYVSDDLLATYISILVGSQFYSINVKSDKSQSVSGSVKPENIDVRWEYLMAANVLNWFLFLKY